MPRGKKDNISKKIIKKIFNSFGLEIKRKNNFQDRYFDSVTEMTDGELKILNEISEIALSSVANQWSIIQSLKHIKQKNIPGEIVECGVYKGGSLILICLISQMIDLNRAIIGFDTFEDGFNGNILIATQTAVSKDLTDFNLFITLMSYPLMGFKVILAIHWHALRLFFKGLRFYSYSEWVNNK